MMKGFCCCFFEKLLEEWRHEELTSCALIWKKVSQDFDRSFPNLYLQKQKKSKNKKIDVLLRWHVIVIHHEKHNFCDIWDQKQPEAVLNIYLFLEVLNESLKTGNLKRERKRSRIPLHFPSCGLSTRSIGDKVIFPCCSYSLNLILWTPTISLSLLSAMSDGRRLKKKKGTVNIPIKFT